MELLGPIWKQRLSYGALATAVVCTLSAYKSSIGANRLSVDWGHGQAKDATTSSCDRAATNPKLSVTRRYGEDAVVTFPRPSKKKLASLPRDRVYLYYRSQ